VVLCVLVLPIVLVVIASVLHAWWNLLLKKCYDKPTFAWLMLIESALICLPMLAFSERTSPPLTGPHEGAYHGAYEARERGARLLGEGQHGQAY